MGKTALHPLLGNFFEKNHCSTTMPERHLKQMDMKKRIAATLMVLMACLNVFAQSQPRYLTRNYKPVDSYRYAAGNTMEIYGGLKWSNGFSIGNTSGPYKAGYATFKVGGQYEKLTFVLGLKKGSYGQDPRIVTVYADGKKIMDEVVILADHINKNITSQQNELNVLSDVSQQAFTLIEGDQETAKGMLNFILSNRNVSLAEGQE